MQRSRIILPAGGALALSAGQAVWMSEDGEIDEFSLSEAIERSGGGVILCHAVNAARRLGLQRLDAYDVLDLFAFVHPARFSVPTIRGLARTLGIAEPKDLAGDCLTLFEIARVLLSDLAEGRGDFSSNPVPIGDALYRSGWNWGPMVLAALGVTPGTQATQPRGFDVWRRLPEWEDEAPAGPPGQMPVEPAEARSRLAEMVAAGHGGRSEPRPQQADFASAVSIAFTPRQSEEAPNTVLVEAGTGVGKTLGYLAAATLWAERNHAPVWVSTYTRNLQHQIDSELDRRFPDRALKEEKVVVRKGRENYVCLLNYADAVRGGGAQPGGNIAIGLMARWIAATRDGDLSGSDFPAWLAELHGKPRTLGLADRRGECIYSACDHYRRCFVEHSARRARHAEIVIANHALVMVQAALGGLDEAYLPTRYVFDEGHHLFDAADSAFAAHLTAFETTELRRWLVGAETAMRSRARGLKRRLEDLVGDDEPVRELLDEIDRASRALPGEGWSQRLAGDQPHGPTERFLAAVRRQVYARTENRNTPYNLEVEARPAEQQLLDAASDLSKAIVALETPIGSLARKLAEKIERESETLGSEDRRRLDAISRSLTRRGSMTLGAWRQMLAALGKGADPEFIDWLGIERVDGRDIDVGFYRHYVDPTRPFAQVVGAQAHGMVVTSATLTDGTGNVDEDWLAAAEVSGTHHLAKPPVRAQVPSPFDYPAHTRVMIVTDVRKDDLDQVAAAYRSLFMAANGGALGLFTAIQRLKAVRERIAGPLEAEGLPLYAQHFDGLDVSTLVEIFRAEEDACLLGTDAIRDGVDVPGRALRLIVFDRVPWPRPDILHRARREALGGRKWDERLTRRRLRQAYGRLIRRADDVGVFVLLDPMMPSRLSGAFPPGVTVQRVGLAEAITQTREFLHRPDRGTVLPTGRSSDRG